MDESLVILNPWAGKGAAGVRRPAIEAALQAANIPFKLYTTHARGGATELAWQGVEAGVKQIITVGGDGTINEVVNGIKGAEAQLGRRVPLGIIPIGTGSDFIKALDNVKADDVEGAVRRITSGTIHSLDLGRAIVDGTESRLFINAVGMGLDAQIAAEALQITRLTGLAVYFLAIIRALAKYKAHPMTVRYDDSQIRRRLLFATVANGVCEGGGFYLTPDAKIDDGLLDVCLVHHLRLDQIIRYLPKAMEGTHTNLSQVTMGHARTITVEGSAPFPVATDGEVISTSARSVQIEVLPNAIDILLGA